MINTYNDYLSLVKDIDREHQEEGYCQLHGISLPPERFSLLTATACFAGEKAYDVLIEDIIFYENVENTSFPPKDFFEVLEDERMEEEHNAIMQEELQYWQYARMMGWE